MTSTTGFYLGSNSQMVFFNDVGVVCSTGGQHASGRIKFIQIWNASMSVQQTTAMEQGCNATGEPTTAHSGPGVANPANHLCPATVTYDFTTPNATLGAVQNLSMYATPPALVSIAETLTSTVCGQQKFTGSSYRLTSGGGLALPDIHSVLPNATQYTIRTVFKLDWTTPYTTIYNVDFQSLAYGYGLQVYGSQYRVSS